MINENQTPTITHEDLVTFEGKDLQIKAEVFEEPIKKSDNHALHTRVSIISIDNGLLWGVTRGEGIGRIYFPEVDKEKLMEIVKAVKRNIAKYKL